ncbi:hypothetical protein [Aquimonas sp.]|uniref:hypothetical protein n=1 Tax=Aquimonas sp. TaxID=1872588 RepID=UPI0037C07610
MDNSFSWRSVAANAVTAGTTSSVTGRMGQSLKLDLTTNSGQFGQDLQGGAVGGVVGIHTRRAAGMEQGVDYGQVAADAFGNALANAATGEHSRRALAALESQHRADLISAELQGRFAEGELQGAALAQALGRSGLPSGSRSHDGLWDRLPADGSRVLLDQRQGSNANGTPWTEQDWARRINDSYERRRFGGARVDFNTVRTDGVRDRRPAQVEALPEILRTAVRSATAQRLDAVEQWRQGGVASWDSYRGSFLGDMTASIATMFFNAGAGGVSGAVSTYGMGTDLRFNRELQASIGFAARNPELVVAAGQAWWAKPLDQKASDLGTIGIGALASGGLSLFKYVDTAADVGAATQKLSLLRRNSEMWDASQDWSVVDGLRAGPDEPMFVADTVASTSTSPNRIYSARELLRRVEEPGPYHNFPETFNDEIFGGTRTQVSDRYVLYTKDGALTLPGEPIYGRAQSRYGDALNNPSGQRVREVIGYTPARVIEGTYEIGVRPSASGQTEVITHRFFRPRQ